MGCTTPRAGEPAQAAQPEEHSKAQSQVVPHVGLLGEPVLRAMGRPGVSGAFGFAHPQFRWVRFLPFACFQCDSAFCKSAVGVAMVWQHCGGRHCPTCAQLLLAQPVGTAHCRYAGFPLFLLLMAQRFCEKLPPALYFAKVLSGSYV